MHKEKLQKTNTVLLESWQGIKLRVRQIWLIFCYKRYHVDWGDGNETMYSSLWYKQSEVEKLVEQKVFGHKKWYYTQKNNYKQHIYCM